jgi:hypothetical protein
MLDCPECRYHLCHNLYHHLGGPLEGGGDGAKVVVVKFVGIDIIVLLKESRPLGLSGLSSVAVIA